MDDRVVLTLERVILVDLNRLEISPLMSLQISHTDQLILEIFFPIVQYLLPAVNKSETFLRWSDPPIDSYYLQACLCFNVVRGNNFMNADRDKALLPLITKSRCMACSFGINKREFKMHLNFTS